MSEATPVRRVVIVSGEAVGDMALAVLTRRLGQTPVEIVYLDLDDQIETPGADTTFPSLAALHRLLRIDETSLMRACGGTFKLGTAFCGWQGTASQYVHAYGPAGTAIDGLSFHHYFAANALAGDTNIYSDYCLAAVAANSRKFALPAPSSAAFGGYSHAYHLNIDAYRKKLRAAAGSHRRIAGTVSGVERDSATGDVTAIILGDGTRVGGDFFIDCSGIASRLLGGALDEPFEDWRTVLPCDRFILAASQPRPVNSSRAPKTTITAGAAGWQWQTPSHTDDRFGVARSSAFMSDEGDEGCGDHLVTDAPSGRRHRAWAHNVVAIGGAAGMIEPLDVSGLQLAQSALARLMTLFPAKARQMRAEAGEFNRLNATQYERARDFAAAHYALSTRTDTPFWRERTAAPYSDALMRKISQFKSRGRLIPYDEDPFLEESWLAVFLGAGLLPRRANPLLMPASGYAGKMHGLRAAIAKTADGMPTHFETLRRLDILPTPGKNDIA